MCFPVSENNESMYIKIFSNVKHKIKNTPETGLDYPSKILCDSPFTWNKGIRFEKKLGVASRKIMKKVKKAWKTAFDSEEL
jgi:hypothetical protein